MIVVESVSTNWFIELGIPILTVIISIAGAFFVSIYSIHHEKKNQKISMMSGYFTEIFNKYTVDKIPMAMEKVIYENGNLSDDFADVVDLLVELKDKARFFKYLPGGFYDSLTKKIKAFEDRAVEISLNVNIDEYAQKNNLTDLNDYMSEIYLLMYDFYIYGEK